jgi:hypothetical protein
VKFRDTFDFVRSELQKHLEEEEEKKIELQQSSDLLLKKTETFLASILVENFYLNSKQSSLQLNTIAKLTSYVVFQTK